MVLNSGFLKTTLSFAALYSSTRDAAFLTRTLLSRFPLPLRTEFLSFQISQHRDNIFSIKPGLDDLCFTSCHITSIKLHEWSKEKGKTILLLHHTSFALSQSQNRCRLVSAPFPHCEHRSSFVICLFFKLALVAKASRHALHAKLLILLGRFSLHMLFQKCFISELSEHSSLLFFPISLMLW